MNTEYFESAEVSDIGRKRKNNEDACLRIPERGVFCVADGMGGQAGGDIASDAIATTLQQVFANAGPEEDATFARRIALFRKATNQASKWIKNFADEKVLGQMGSTIVALVIDPRNPSRAAALHAGDSRLYRYRNGEFKQITADHSAVASLAAKLGIHPDKIPAKYQNELLRAVGLTEAVELEKTPVEIFSGDLYLICSDGLSKMLTDEQIAKILKDGAKDSIATVAQRLINTANEAGGKDNVTVVLVKAGDLSNAPTVLDPDEEEDKTTIAATVTPSAETPIQHYPSHHTPSHLTPATETGDVHGDTPHTPTQDAKSENQKPEKETADKPPAPVQTSIPTPIPIPVAATAPAAQMAAEIPKVKKASQPEIKPAPEPEKKKSSLAGVVFFIAVVLSAAAGIWFAVGSKLKITAPSAVLPAEPAVSNPSPVIVAVPPTKPAPQPPATNAAPDQTQVTMQEAGREALKNAQAAFDRHDYQNAATLAAAALQKIPGDPVATNLQADALAQLKILDTWRVALTNGQTAFNNKDYKNAVTWATEALKAIPNEQAATKLLDNAQQQLAAAEQLQKYQAALQAGQDALKNNDFTLAETKAKEALSLRPNDPAAEQIIQQMQLAMDLDSARRFFGEGDYDTTAQICQSHPTAADFKQLAASSQAEQAALADAKNRFNVGDYSFVAQLQKQTYSRKPPFADLLNQATGEQKLLANLTSLKQAGDWNSVAAKLATPPYVAVTNKVPFRALSEWAQSQSVQAQKQKLLQQATVSFEELLVWFNIKAPTDPYIKTAEARAQKPVNGAILNQQRQQYLASVAWLEDTFGKMGILNQNDRAKYLNELKDTISHHE